MKKLLCFCCGLLVATVGVRATVLFSDTFTYPNGNLVGQGPGPWAQTGTSSTTPIQVNAGVAVMGSIGGQDANSWIPFYTLVDGSSIYFGADLNVSTAAVAGDYFMHWAPSSSSTAFMSRLEIRSTAGGFNVGLINSSSGTLTWGADVFSFGAHRVVVSYDSITGTLNDTGNVWVDGTHEIIDNPWGAATNPEPTALGAINLRQGGATTSPGLTVDNLNVATSFAEVATFTAVVPEPTSLSLLGGFGLLALLISRRRR